MYWQHRHTVLVPGFPEYAACESRAAEAGLLEAGVVPGPLQAGECASALEAGIARSGGAAREQAQGA